MEDINSSSNNTQFENILDINPEQITDPRFKELVIYGRTIYQKALLLAVVLYHTTVMYEFITQTPTVRSQKLNDNINNVFSFFKTLCTIITNPNLKFTVVGSEKIKKLILNPRDEEVLDDIYSLINEITSAGNKHTYSDEFEKMKNAFSSTLEVNDDGIFYSRVLCDYRKKILAHYIEDEKYNQVKNPLQLLCLFKNTNNQSMLNNEDLKFYNQDEEYENLIEDYKEQLSGIKSVIPKNLNAKDEDAKKTNYAKFSNLIKEKINKEIVSAVGNISTKISLTPGVLSRLSGLCLTYVFVPVEKIWHGFFTEPFPLNIIKHTQQCIKGSDISHQPPKDHYHHLRYLFAQKLVDIAGVKGLSKLKYQVPEEKMVFEFLTRVLPNTKHYGYSVIPGVFNSYLDTNDTCFGSYVNTNIIKGNVTIQQNRLSENKADLSKFMSCLLHTCIFIANQMSDVNQYQQLLTEIETVNLSELKSKDREDVGKIKNYLKNNQSLFVENVLIAQCCDEMIGSKKSQSQNLQRWWQKKAVVGLPELNNVQITSNNRKN